MSNLTRKFSELLSLLQDAANHAPEDNAQKKLKKKALKDGLNTVKDAANYLGVGEWDIEIPKPGWVTELEAGFSNAQTNMTDLQNQISLLQQEIQHLQDLTSEQLIRQAVSEINQSLNQTETRMGKLIRTAQMEISTPIDSNIIPGIQKLNKALEGLVTEIIDRMKTDIFPGISIPHPPIVKVNDSQCYTPWEVQSKLKHDLEAGQDPTVLDIYVQDGVDIPSLRIGPARKDVLGIVFIVILALVAIVITVFTVGSAGGASQFVTQLFDMPPDYDYHLITFESRTDSSTSTHQISVQWNKG